jgi:sugar lactone lactonase YvrE
VHIVSAAQEDYPFFLPGGDLVFRAVEGGSNFLYRMKPDGTERRKVSPERILDAIAVSPDGRWVVVQMPTPGEEHTTATKVVATDGSATVTLCAGLCMPHWDTTGKFLYLFFQELNSKTYPIPVVPSTGLPKTPPDGFARLEDFTSPKTDGGIPWYVESAVSSTVYAYTRDNTRRNLYRIPLP